MVRKEREGEGEGEKEGREKKSKHEMPPRLAKRPRRRSEYFFVYR